MVSDAPWTQNEVLTPLNRGDRVVVGGKHRATVRYVGAVDGQAGSWIGLEWDDPGRGKHDGTHDGKRYFVSRVRGAASFVRYTSLVKHGVSTGVSLEEAVRTKYKEIEVVSPGKRGQTASGFPVVRGDVDRINKLLREDGALEVAGLANLCICSVRDRLSFLNNVKEIDLSNNLLSEQSWVEVLELVASLPRLQVLNLSNNRMGDFFVSRCGGRSDEHYNRYRNTNVTTLALNGCMISQEETVRWIGTAFLNLEELYLYDNRIKFEKSTSVHVTGDVGAVSSCAQSTLPFGTLRVVDLGENSLESWEDLEHFFGGLPRLRMLSLEGNAFNKVRVSDRGRFLALEHLNMARNRLEDWDRGIQELEQLVSLRELRFSENPLCSDSPDIDRLIALGRLGKLAWINGSDVTAAERRDSELAFLRNLDQYVMAVFGPLEKRVAALERTYGVTRNASGATMAACTSLDQSMVLMELVRESEAIVSKRIPSSLVLGKLEKVVDKLLTRSGVCQVGDASNERLEIVLGGVQFEAGVLFDGGTRRTVAEVLSLVRSNGDP